MASVNPPRGMRDFLPADKARRERVLAVIRERYRAHGFDEIETPVMEDYDRLHAGIGGDNEKLAFNVLKRGLDAEAIAAAADQPSRLSDLGLRYDLTVPLARVVGMNPQMPKPFKRYQIAPVWRAEKPGRGRFREFVQCDVDIVGCADLTADAECLAVGAAVLRALGVEDFVLRVNNRKLLTALLARLGIAEGEPAMAVLRTVDKLPKIGEEAVRALLQKENGLSAEAADGIFEFLGLDPATLSDWFADSEVGQKGAEELNTLLQLAAELGVRDKVEVDLSIARGLDYYTGTIYETFLTASESLGSVMSGGRYDDLLGMFGGASEPAVGISLGVDRLFAGLLELGLVEADGNPTRVLVTVFDDSTRPASY
ncbi:MAG: histidine--tRNA ligase, partial [Microthrixaceae bacterium]|nr:histidine--tRNA ligase [Microthrixaceae bacterium]